VLVVLWIIDCVFVTSLARADTALAAGSMRLAIDFVLLLVTIIGGRIVPAFTTNALRRRGDTVATITRKPVEYSVIGLMIAIAVTDVYWPQAWFSGILAALAAAAHGLRLAGWRSSRTRGEPILWIMHVAYAWLPLGFALKAFALLGDFAWASRWQHAFGAGVLATMILAVMTRVSLGHTGRPLIVSRAIVAAYVLLTAAALLRVFGIALFPAHYLLTLTVAATAWMLSFGIFLLCYAPILWRPRADGAPG
jgi:uncharacterized protein involved in response to NO